MGKSTTTTTKQENSPPAWAQPLFERSASEASRLYNSGSGGNTYLGPTVARLSGTTMQGVNQLARAGQGWNTAGTRPLFQRIGAGAVSNPYMSNLDEMASGKWLEEGNPYFNERLEQGLGDTAAQVRSLMSGMGRGGSGAETRMLTDRLGGLRTEALAQDWDRNLNAMLGANQTAGGLYATGIGQSMDAANAMSGLDQRNFENRLAGAGATLEAGNILDQQAQQQLADRVAKFYALDSQDWNRLSMLQGAAAGAAGPYGTQLATSRQPTNPWNAIGGLFAGKSDMGLKENIVIVGAMNGIPVFEFNYKGQDDRWRGTLAQAIPMFAGDAVIMEDDGYYAVDYARLGFPMQRVIQAKPTHLV